MKTVEGALLDALEFLNEDPTMNELIDCKVIDNGTTARSVFKLKWDDVAFEFEVLISLVDNTAVACVLHRHKFKRARMCRLMNTFMNALNNDPLDLPALDNGKNIPLDDEEDVPQG
jgi:hypothetical protein